MNVVDKYKSVGQLDPLTFLDEQSLTLRRELESCWKATMVQRLHNAWQRMRRDPATRDAFHGTAEGPELKHGHLRLTTGFDRMVSEALKGLADLDNERDARSDSVKNKQGVAYLGHWATISHNLAACLELSRSAEYLRVDWKGGLVNPGYIPGSPFRNKRFDIDNYRQQQLRLFIPHPERAFLVCKVRELGLRVLLNLARDTTSEANATHFDDTESTWPLDNSMIAEDERWLNNPDFFDNISEVRDHAAEALLRKCNRYDLMAALFEAKLNSYRDLKDYRNYLRTPVIDILRRMHEPCNDIIISDQLRAVVETLSLGFAPAHTVALIHNEYGYSVSESQYREMSEWFLDFFDLTGVYNLQPALAESASFLGIEVNRLSSLLVSLNRNDEYDSSRMSPLSVHDWSELCGTERDANSRSDFLQKTISASNTELMIQIKQASDTRSRRHSSRLLKLLTLLTPGHRRTEAELASQLRRGLKRTGLSLAELVIPPCYPTELKRKIYVQSCQDVQVSVAKRLLAANLKVVALTKSEILLESETSQARAERQRVESLALEATEPLLGTYAGPIDVVITGEW